MNDEIEQDSPLTIEQEMLVAALSEAELQMIDQALLRNACVMWRKVARVVGTTMGELEGRFSGIPDVFFAQRIQYLAAKGQIEFQGNLKRMRYSEIRVPNNENGKKS